MGFVPLNEGAGNRADTGVRPYEKANSEGSPTAAHSSHFTFYVFDVLRFPHSHWRGQCKQLPLDQLLIRLVGRQQLLVLALANNPATVHHDDFIGATNRADAVRDDERGPARE